MRGIQYRRHTGTIESERGRNMAKLRRHITSRRARAISALLLLSAAIAVFSPCTSPSFYAASVSQNKAKLNELQQQINNYSDKIDSISSSVSGLLAEKER